MAKKFKNNALKQALLQVKSTKKAVSNNADSLI